MWRTRVPLYEEGEIPFVVVRQHHRSPAQGLSVWPEARAGNWVGRGDPALPQERGHPVEFLGANRPADNRGLGECGDLLMPVESRLRRIGRQDLEVGIVSQIQNRVPRSASWMRATHGSAIPREVEQAFHPFLKVSKADDDVIEMSRNGSDLVCCQGSRLRQARGSQRPSGGVDGGATGNQGGPPGRER